MIHEDINIVPGGLQYQALEFSSRLLCCQNLIKQVIQTEKCIQTKAVVKKSVLLRKYFSSPVCSFLSLLIHIPA
jgi:hypothetical protein